MISQRMQRHKKHTHRQNKKTNKKTGKVETKISTRTITTTEQVQCENNVTRAWDLGKI